MIINFMDNAFDSMAYMFTRGQVYRMHYVLNSMAYRGNLCNTAIACSDSIFSTEDTISNPVIPVYHDFFKIYPNPANNLINIDIEVAEPGPVFFSLYNVSGKLLMQGKWTESTNQYSKTLVVSNLFAGIYFINLSTRDETKTYPIVIIE